jgi:predicted enzyme related to lactoylglutathione lyase
MITTIATVAVYVEDQQKSVDFWTRQVGFRVHSSQSMGPEGSWIEVGPAESTACLVLYPKQIMPDWAERKPSVVFNADDLERTYAEMTARGVQFSQPPQALAWGLFAVFEDSDGNSFGLRQPS